MGCVSILFLKYTEGPWSEKNSRSTVIYGEALRECCIFVCDSLSCWSLHNSGFSQSPRVNVLFLLGLKDRSIRVANSTAVNIQKRDSNYSSEANQKNNIGWDEKENAFKLPAGINTLQQIYSGFFFISVWTHLREANENWQGKWTECGMTEGGHSSVMEGEEDYYYCEISHIFTLWSSHSSAGLSVWMMIAQFQIWKQTENSPSVSLQ